MIVLLLQINLLYLLIQTMKQNQREITWLSLVTLLEIHHRQYHGPEMDFPSTQMTTLPGSVSHTTKRSWLSRMWAGLTAEDIDVRRTTALEMLPPMLLYWTCIVSPVLVVFKQIKTNLYITENSRKQTCVLTGSWIFCEFFRHWIENCATGSCC